MGTRVDWVRIVILGVALQVLYAYRSADEPAQAAPRVEADMCDRPTNCCARLKAYRSGVAPDDKGEL